MLVGDLLECLRDLDFLLSLLAAHHAPEAFIVLLSLLKLLLGLELATTNSIPRCNGHAEVTSHRNDLPLHVTEQIVSVVSAVKIGVLTVA